MLLGHGDSYLIFLLATLLTAFKTIPQYIDTKSFWLMLLTGFLAQMVDGSLGMGYGTISTTFLLANGVNPAIVSSRVHTASVFSSGVSGYTHHRFGNINKKLLQGYCNPGNHRCSYRCIISLLWSEIFTICSYSPFIVYNLSWLLYNEKGI